MVNTRLHMQINAWLIKKCTCHLSVSLCICSKPFVSVAIVVAYTTTCIINRKIFVLEIVRAINFRDESFSYKRPLTMYVNVNNVHTF